MSDVDNLILETLDPDSTVYEHDDHYTYTVVTNGMIHNIIQVSDLRLRRALSRISTKSDPPLGLNATWNTP